MGLLEADDQRGDWYGWVTNQAGHAAIVGQPAGLALWAFGVPPFLVFAVVVTVYLVVWEFLTQGGSDWRDSIMDTANVAAGVAVILMALGGSVGLTGLVLLVWGVLLAFGVWRRL